MPRSTALEMDIAASIQRVTEEVVIQEILAEREQLR
jgi:hypothetical protein